MHVLNSCSWALPFVTTSMFMCWRFVNGCYVCRPITSAYSTGFDVQLVRMCVRARSCIRHVFHNAWCGWWICLAPQYVNRSNWNFTISKTPTTQFPNWSYSFYKGHDQATDSCPQTCPSKLHGVYLCSGMVITCPHEEDLACHDLSWFIWVITKSNTEWKDIDTIILQLTDSLTSCLPSWEDCKALVPNWGALEA